MSAEAATKQDLKDLERDLKAFILEREISAIRWFVTIQLTYFFGTIGMVYFLITHLQKP